MSRILLIILFSTFSICSQAQEVYDMVLDNATRIVNSPTSSFLNTQIAQFKRTALIYIKSKAFERTDSVPAKFLNTQAYYLTEFLNLFFAEMIKIKDLPEKARKQRILRFMDASACNPLFHDPDEESTLSFVENGGEVTPFSLDTDWQKAYLAAKAIVEKE